MNPTTSETPPDAPEFEDEAFEPEDEDLPTPVPGVASEPGVAPAGAGTPGHEDLDPEPADPAPDPNSSEPGTDGGAGRGRE